MIQVSNPLAGYLSRRAEIDEAIKTVMDGGQYILGEQVRLFEQEFAEYIGVQYAIGVSSGTDALFLSLRACGVRRGFNVAVPTLTAPATVAAILLTDATPTFIDVDPRRRVIHDDADLGQLNRCQAVIPVHLHGNPVDMSKIKADAAWTHIIEDCAQAHGAKHQGKRVGSIGDVGCFSFYPTKNLGGYGDGGMIVTDDPELHDAIVSDRTPKHHPESTNSRLDELQAAILRVKLKHLDRDNRKRRVVARYYDDNLPDVIERPYIGAGDYGVYHQYVICLDDRDDFMEFMADRGVGTAIHYPECIHKMIHWGDMKRYPNSEMLADRMVSLPIYPELGLDKVDQVLDGIDKWVNR